jgi:hypothetical protein
MPGAPDVHRAVDAAAWAVAGRPSAVVRQTIANTEAVRRFRDFDIVIAISARSAARFAQQPIEDSVAVS